MRIGDAANVFVLVNSGAFLAVVLLQNAKRIDVLSATFLREGFCDASPGTFFSSHAMCFYVDTVCAVVLVALCRRFADRPWIDAVGNAAPATLAHGAAHLGIWYAGGDGGLADAAAAEVGAAKAVAGVVGFAAFFFLLLRSAPRVPETHAAVHSAVVAAVYGRYVPPIFGFTYVQTALLWINALYDLGRAEKGVSYDLFASIVSVPVGVVAWAEGLACDAWFKAAGGHVWYDAIIPLSMFCYLGCCVFDDGCASFLDDVPRRRAKVA